MSKTRQQVSDGALARLWDAIENGTGWRVSAVEVEAFAVEQLAAWASDAHDRVTNQEDSTTSPA